MNLFKRKVKRPCDNCITVAICRNRVTENIMNNTRITTDPIIEAYYDMIFPKCKAILHTMPRKFYMEDLQKAVLNQLNITDEEVLNREMQRMYHIRNM